MSTNDGGPAFPVSTMVEERTAGADTGAACGRAGEFGSGIAASETRLSAK